MTDGFTNFRFTRGEARDETTTAGGNPRGFGELYEPEMLRGCQSQRNDQVVQGFSFHHCDEQRRSVDAKQNAAERHTDGIRAEIRAGQEKRRWSLFLQGGQRYR